MFQNWLNKHLIKAIGIALGVDFLFFGLTNATKVPALALVGGFFIVVCNIYLGACAVAVLLRWYGISLGNYRNKLIITATVLLSALVGLQSTGQLTSKDLIVLLPLIVIGYFYSSYQKTH